jgi:coenzyme F420 hydrogenase subunit beta
VSFAHLRQAVLDPGLCAGCGLCAAVCPEEVIRFDGAVRPQVPSSWDTAACGACTECLDVCPGADPATPSSELRLFGRTRAPRERWLGIYDMALAGRARNDTVFAASASGGSITALLQAATSLFDLDHVLTMGRDPRERWRAAPSLGADVDNLIDTAQSTYQLAPYLAALRDLLATRPARRVALTGLACHVQAVRKLQALDNAHGQWARDNVVFVVELACSSGTLPSGTRSLIEDVVGADPDDVAELRYRAGNYPGQVRLALRDGNTHEVPFWKAVRHFAGAKTHRCLTCGDWMSGLADVSVCDGDPNIFDASLGRQGNPKHGRLLVRTSTGAQVLAHGIATGLIETWSTDLAGMNLGLERKRNRRVRHEQAGTRRPAGPIPGHIEQLDPVADEEFLRVPAGSDGAAPAGTGQPGSAGAGAVAGAGGRR